MVVVKSMNELTVSLIVHEDFTHIYGALVTLFEQATAYSLVVYVVINKGTSAEIERLRAAFPQVLVVENSQPQGFAANHNQIMRRTQTPLVALFNDDIELQAGALEALYQYLEQHPRVGLVGASLFNPDGTPQVSVYSDPKLLLTLYKISGIGRLTAEGTPLRALLQRLKVIKLSSWVAQTEDREVDVLKGVVMMVRREAYEQVGLMDESTRMYGEEIDWHLRFRQGGWKIGFVAHAKVTHYGIGQRLTLNTLVEDRKSLLNYYLKHKPRRQAQVLRAALVATHAFGAVISLPIKPQRAKALWQVVTMAMTWHVQAPTRMAGNN